jgi:hypothetical protein
VETSCQHVKHRSQNGKVSDPYVLVCEGSMDVKQGIKFGQQRAALTVIGDRGLFQKTHLVLVSQKQLVLRLQDDVSFCNGGACLENL